VPSVSEHLVDNKNDHTRSARISPAQISKRAVQSQPTAGSALRKADNQTAPLSAELTAFTHRKSTELKLRRAWDLALSSVMPHFARIVTDSRPAKQLPMQAVMLYFSGSGVQIFSLGMIFMLLTGPISAVLNIFGGTSTALISCQPD